jgi:hypothetical protein
VWAAPALAAADPVTLLFNRSTLVSVESGIARFALDTDFNADALSAEATFQFGPMTAFGTATLSSRLSPDAQTLSGNGHAEATAQITGSGPTFPIFETLANNTLVWRFSLPEPHLFDFVATFAPSAAPIAQAVWSAHLCDFVNGECLFEAQEQAAGMLTERHQLGVGTYQFRVFSTALGSVFSQDPGISVGTVDHNFTVNLTPAPSAVPEPASVALLSTGLIALVGRARKRGNGGSARAS